MPTVSVQLEQAVRAAIEAAFGFDADPQIGLSQNEKFGDYQVNAAMGLAKVVAEKTGQKTNPRTIAEQIKARLNLGEMIAEPPSIAGPGFINIKLSPKWLASQLESIADDSRAGVPTGDHPQTIVVDYSGPNVAKQMHVGHLRSTIIGDAIARVLAFQGHHVIRQNHIGDWGTQFGRVVFAIWYAVMADELKMAEIVDQQATRWKKAADAKDDAALSALVKEVAKLDQKFVDLDPTGETIFAQRMNVTPLDLGRLEMLYQFISGITSHPAAKTTTVTHPAHGAHTLEELPRLTTTFIQNPNDPKNQPELIAWKKATQITMETCNATYRQLGVQLGLPDIQTEPMVRGESFYNPQLPEIVKELRSTNIATESSEPIEGEEDEDAPAASARREDRRVVVFNEGFKTPLVIQKTDGGFLYGTTDLAGIRFRVSQLHANRIIYTHDSRQALHFAQVFATAKKAGWANGVSLEYAPFGTMLGEDGKPFKTRSGETIKLKNLLDEAEERALALIAAKNSALAPELQKQIAHAVGIGAVKYSDLSKDRVSDYVFSWEKMLSFDGNTAPYLQNAYVRIQSIFRKAGGKPKPPFHIELGTPHEQAVAKQLLRFGDVIELVGRELKPHHLSTYLYELATLYHAFYEHCPVLQSSEPVKSSRLALSELTGRTLALGLDLMGIEHPDQM